MALTIYTHTLHNIIHSNLDGCRGENRNVHVFSLFRIMIVIIILLLRLFRSCLLSAAKAVRHCCSLKSPLLLLLLLLLLLKYRLGRDDRDRQLFLVRSILTEC